VGYFCKPSQDSSGIVFLKYAVATSTSHLIMSTFDVVRECTETHERIGSIIWLWGCRIHLAGEI
jgi:hypothetical protein